MSNSVQSPAKLLTSLSEISSQYDLFILDMWGVLYNGTGLYEGVIYCLKELKTQNKKIILLSNAPRTKPYVKENLAAAGLTDEFYNGVLTSGDITNQFLRSSERTQNFPGSSVYFIGAERHLVLFEKTGLNIVEQPEKADFILMTGPREFARSLSEFKPELEKCAEYDLPMICSNPDKYVMMNDEKIICGGLLGQYYQNLGQKVQYFGKPYGMTYKAVKEFYPDIAKDKMLVVGDALETDIKGGSQAGLDSLLIAGGIHLNDLGSGWGNPPSQSQLNTLCEQYDLWPTYAISNFKW